MSRHWSEDLAKAYLLEQGYTFRAANYTIRGAEIDLIMQDGEVVVFVEVKQRKNADYGIPFAHISPAKLKRLRQAALHYLVTTFERDDVFSRFDAISVLGSKEKHWLEHLQNIY